MFGLGMSEIIVLAVLGLIVIGPKELPELARTIGRFLNELKRTTDGLGEDLKQQIRLDRLNSLTDLENENQKNFDEIQQKLDEIQKQFPPEFDHQLSSHASSASEPEQLEFQEPPVDSDKKDETKKS